MFTFLFLIQSVHSSSFVMFDKKVLSDDGKIGEPVHVLYSIYNLGDSDITDLHIDDSGITRDQWEFPKSAGNLRWSVLEAGKNLTYVFTVKPIASGNLRMGPSRLNFIADGQKKIAMSSSLFWFDSKSTRSIGAKSNLIGYAITTLAGLASIFVPYFIWLLSKNSDKMEQKKVKAN